MAILNIAKAKKNNSIYASLTKPPWKERFYQVAEQLGIFYQTPNAEAFAQAVYQWQSTQAGLLADGILGPKSWAQLEPRTRYSIGFDEPVPDWTKMPPGWKPDVPDTPEKNGITDHLDEMIENDPSFKTTLINSGVFVASYGLGKLKALGKLGGFAAGAVVQPLVWAFQGNTGDAGDKLLYGLGLFPPLTVAAGIAGIWKGRMDDDVLDKLAEVTASEPSHLSKAIYPAATYGWTAQGPILAQKIASNGGVAWQHPNGLWVFIKLEQGGKEILMCDYEPRNAAKILGPELPLRWMGSGFSWRSYKGGF